MPTDVSNPLANVIKTLAATKVEGPAAEIRKRFTDASDVIVVLADCSGSMADFVGSSGTSKFKHLQIALEDLMQGFPKIRLVAFGSIAKEVESPKHLPDPTRGMSFGGSTNLAGALEMAARWKPQKTIVISDGEPDSESDALEMAQRMTGSIDTIYCGWDGDPGVQFLRMLSRRTGGRGVVWDGRHEIAGVIRGLLPAPE